MLRYRFSDFIVSPRRRVLSREGRELPLIPRYFDLLVLLIEHRHEAVHKREIFDRVWGDVIVSDSALSQAIRTIRRTLGDDSREPRFIRTVSRHGYRFVFADVHEEEDDGEFTPATAAADGNADRTALVAETAGERLAAPAGTAGIVARRSASAAVSAGATGAIAGTLGGLTLAAIPESQASLDLAPVLAVIGAASAALGGASVAAGLSLAEASTNAYRAPALVAGGAVGGAVVGTAAQWLARWSLAALVGVTVPVGGGLEGVAIGAAAGAACALARRWWTDGGGRRALRAAAVAGLTCGLAGAMLSGAGRPLVGGTVHAIAQAARGSKVTLDPLGKLIGENGFGPVTRGVVGFSEAAFFGFGLGLGYFRRDPNREA